ncbi:MAG: alpha/beta hydrolase, partial [Magnetospirillum sp. WYHS-4]
SLGGAIATHMAWETGRAGTPLAGLILEAPFTSMADAAQRHYPYLPARWLVRDRYASIDKIAHVATPVAILHGTADGVVPFDQGLRLLEAAREPKLGLWIPDGGHEVFGEEALDQALAFLSAT